MSMEGLIVGIHDASPASPIPIPAIISTFLFCLAIGINVPRRMTLWICLAAWRRFFVGSRTSDQPLLLLDSETPSPSLCWGMQSVEALVAGVLMAAMPFLFHRAVAIQHWLQTHFVWSDLPLTLLQAGSPFVAALIPLAAVGLAISGAHLVSGALGQWDTRATAWLSIGAAVGLIAASAAIHWLRGPDPVMLMAAVLPLIASIIAASASARTGHQLRDAEMQKRTLPLWSDRWPLLLRASIIVVGAGAVCSMFVWTAGAADSQSDCRFLLPGMLVALGLGSLLGCRRKSRGSRSIGGFGVACAASGVITAAGVYGVQGSIRTECADAAVAALASTGAIGFAAAYGRQTLLQRVANRTAVGATILSGLLIASALTVGITAPASLHFFDRAPTAMMLGLSLLAIGGTLIIHEPTYSRRTRRLRLCAVFAALGGLIVSVMLYPPVARSRGVTSIEPAAWSASLRAATKLRHSVVPVNDR